MTQFRVVIKVDNDAYQPSPNDELARNLREIAQKIEDSGITDPSGVVIDYNGNLVGRWGLAEKFDEVVEPWHGKATNNG